MPEPHTAFWLLSRLHNRGGLTCLPTQVWRYCAVYKEGLENLFLLQLQIMYLHKCLHGQIPMNNFPPPPSLPISAGKTSMSTCLLMQCDELEASDSSSSFAHAWLFISLFFFCHWLIRRNTEHIVFLCSTLGIEGRGKAPFRVVLCKNSCLQCCPSGWRFSAVHPNYDRRY